MRILVLVLISINFGTSLIFSPSFASVDLPNDMLKRLENAQTVEEVEAILQEFIESKVYKDACRELYKELEKHQGAEPREELEKALPVVQNYYRLACDATAKYWKELQPMKLNAECNQIILEFDEYNNKFFDLQKEAELKVLEIGQKEAEDWLNNSEVHYSREMRAEKDSEFRGWCVPYHNDCANMKNELRNLSNEYDQMKDETFEKDLLLHDYNRLKHRINLMCDFANRYTDAYPDLVYSLESICGKGTIEKNGQCVPDPNYQRTLDNTSETKSKFRGGCLIATATYGSELSTQVQQLRELRDNSLLQTKSGTTFMAGFNQFYYSFSPTISDWERQSPIFKETVKITITPLIMSFLVLNYVEMDSEVEVLGFGISLILLNVGMYFVAPAIVIWKLRILDRFFNEIR